MRSLKMPVRIKYPWLVYIDIQCISFLFNNFQSLQIFQVINRTEINWPINTPRRRMWCCVTCVLREAGYWPCHKLEQKANEGALLETSNSNYTYMDQHDFVPDEFAALMIIR